MFLQALKQPWEPCNPLFPVVIARSRVELISKVTFFKERGKLLIWPQWPFLVSARQKEIRGIRRVSRAHKNKRVVAFLYRSSPGSEDRSKAPPLLQSLDRKRPAQYIQRRANPPANANDSGWRSARLTAPNPPIETPTIARSPRWFVTGNFPATSSMRSFTM